MSYEDTMDWLKDEATMREDENNEIQDLRAQLAAETKRREEAEISQKVSNDRAEAWKQNSEKYRKNWLSLQNAIGEECQLQALDRINEWKERDSIDAARGAK